MKYNIIRLVSGSVSNFGINIKLMLCVVVVIVVDVI